MSKKWNLQDIRPANAPKQPVRPTPAVRQTHSDISARAPKQRQQESFNDPDLATIDVIDGNVSRKKRVFVTTSLITLVVFFGFAVNIMLGGATITVHPKTKDVSVQSEFTAYTAPQTAELSYELLTLQASAEKQVQAAGKEQVEEQARGIIFVYNTNSTAPQRLITNTRFESPEGLIFRIKDSIEIPPAMENSEGELIPGKISAEVFADGPGEQYNIAPTRFTVPGLEGTDQFDSVYAESTTAFEGGFEGEKYIIDEAELQTAQQELHLELRNVLLEDMRSQIPAGFILYEEAVTFVYESLPATTYGDSLATIKEQATLNVPMFKADDFAAYLAEKSVPDYEDEDVFLEDPHTLSFTYTDPATPLGDIRTVDELDFTLTGTTKIIWKYDPEQLKEDLAGMHKNQAATVFVMYGSIGHAQAELKPFWAKNFPEDTKKIEVISVTE